MNLRIHQLSKHYGNTPVFANVTLDVAPGEFVAIIGESGVGKSTLVNRLLGEERMIASDVPGTTRDSIAVDHWDSGTVQLEGIDIGQLSDDERALLRRKKVGFVFQAFHVLPHLDVAQNVGLPLLLLNQPDAVRVADMLAAVGLQDLGARLPQQLSGGQLQRVAIARALVHRPTLLLADEPTGNLDPSTAAMVMQALVTQTRAHGASLVLVTHSLAAAEQADRVLHLRADGVQ